jgi:hypothetical protein
MMVTGRYLRGVLVTAAAALALSFPGCGGESGNGGEKTPPAASGSVTKTAGSGPVFVTLEGKPRRLSDYRGRIVVVNYIAAWNNDSKELVGIMNEIDRRNHENVAVIGVLVGASGPAQARTFSTGNDVRFEILLQDRKIPVGKLPTTNIYTRDGKLYYSFEGLQREMRYADLLARMRKRRM